MINKIVIYSVMFVILLGCTRSVSYMRYMDNKYEPTSSIEVLRRKPITKNFIELGELKLRISRRDEDDAIIKLKAKARLIGAHALIVLGESSNGSVAVPLNTGQGTMYAMVNKRYITAIAIRYK